MTKQKRIIFFSVFFTFFVDTLSWAIVFPIFAPYFLDAHNVLFSADVSYGTRTMLLGFFLTAFSFGQFLGAPLMGEYADKHGRKKALGWGIFFTFLGLLLSAWSMQIHNLYFLFLGRLITGLFASSTAVCLSAISDLSENEKFKVKHFGYLSAIAGLSFIIGAYLGGKLADKSVNSYFHPSDPLWLAAAITLVNFFFIILAFRETTTLNPNIKYHFFESFQNIKTALRTEKIKKAYCVYFLFLLAWTILFQFISVLTVKKFAFTYSNIGDLALFMGICWGLGSAVLNKILVKHFTTHRILEICLIGFMLFCGLVIFPKTIWGVLPILGICVILGGLAWPTCIGLISSMVPQAMQGKILGVSQSVQSFAMAMGPVIAGLAIHATLALPFLIAAFISLCAVITYFTLKSQ